MYIIRNKKILRFELKWEKDRKKRWWIEYFYFLIKSNNCTGVKLLLIISIIYLFIISLRKNQLFDGVVETIQMWIASVRPVDVGINYAYKYNIVILFVPDDLVGGARSHRRIFRAGRTPFAFSVSRIQQRRHRSGHPGGIVVRQDLLNSALHHIFNI